jgi:5'-phosphate synthase pdxT subunit
VTHRPTVGVFALQGDVREHLHVLESLGVRALGVRRTSELDGCDALVLPGGESTTMAKLARTFDLFDPIRKRLAEGMPTLGTCAGMILLAQEVLDGRADQRSLGVVDITVRRNAFGRQVDSFEADLDLTSGGAPVPGGPFHAVFIRAPIIESAGPDVEVLARVRDRPVLARQGPAVVASFHPELTADLRLHRLFLSPLEES